MFNILGMLIAGLIIGLLAQWLYPGSPGFGFWKTIGLGIGGSFLGGLITQMAKPPKEGIRLNRAGLFMSIFGSILVLFISKRLHLW